MWTVLEWTHYGHSLSIANGQPGLPSHPLPIFCTPKHTFNIRLKNRRLWQSRPVAMCFPVAISTQPNNIHSTSFGITPVVVTVNFPRRKLPIASLAKIRLHQLTRPERIVYSLPCAFPLQPARPTQPFRRVRGTLFAPEAHKGRLRHVDSSPVGHAPGLFPQVPELLSPGYHTTSPEG